MRTALSFLLLLSLGAGVLRAGEPGDPPHPDDTAIVRRVGAQLPLEGSVEAIQAALGATPDEVRDLGFGATWRRLALYGHEVTLWIDVVAYEGRVAGTRIRSLGGNEAWKQEVRRSWGEAVRVKRDGIETRHELPAGMRAWRVALTRGLGAPPETPVAPAAQAAVDLLSDPLADLTVGSSCYEDGSPPEGREAADALRRAGALVALDHVLCGPGPEGRVYAAEALLILETEGVTLGVDRRRVLERVLALQIPIRSCDGCLVYDEPAAKLVSADQLRGRILCRIVERLYAGSTWKDVGEVRVFRDGTYTRRAEPAESGPDAEARWTRGRLPQTVLEPLVAAVRKGDGFLVHLGTPMIVRPLEDSTTKPLPAIQALFDHLDEPSTERDDSRR